MTLIALNKPFQMMSQFSAHPTRAVSYTHLTLPTTF